MDLKYFIEKAFQANNLHPQIIALPEAQDVRVNNAALLAAEQNLFKNIVVFDKNAAKNSACKSVILAADMFSSVMALEDLTEEVLTEVASARGKLKDANQIQTAKKNHLMQAGALLNRNKVHSVVAGSLATTAEVIRAALATVGLKPKTEVVSGSFLLAKNENVLLFADCAVVASPNEMQLLSIAEASVETFIKLTELKPKVAFLSFATKNSAQHELVFFVETASKNFKKRHPDLTSDGPLQFDAAFVPEISRSKNPGSEIYGDANIFIFPDLNSGNISYKIAQRLGGFECFGPLLQGLNKTYLDLSRGASQEDILMVMCLSTLLSR